MKNFLANLVWEEAFRGSGKVWEPVRGSATLVSYQFFPLLQFMGKFTGITSLLLVKICRASFLATYNLFPLLIYIRQLLARILLSFRSWAEGRNTMLQIRVTVFHHSVANTCVFRVRCKCCREGSGKDSTNRGCSQGIAHFWNIREPSKRNWTSWKKTRQHLFVFLHSFFFVFPASWICYLGAWPSIAVETKWDDQNQS